MKIDDMATDEILRELENKFGKKEIERDLIEWFCESDICDEDVEDWSDDEILDYFSMLDQYDDVIRDWGERYLESVNESNHPRGRILREGAYNEGKRVWKITAIADNDYEDDVVRYFRTEKAADEAYEDMSKDNTYKFVEEPEEYVIQYNDDIEAEPNYWMDGTVSWIEGDYDFGDYTVEVDGGLPTIAMKFNYNNDYADEDNEIFLQGIDAEIAVNEICDIYSNGDKTPKEAVELWSRQYA